MRIERLKYLIILSILFNILSISISHSKDTNYESSDTNKIYPTKKMKNYRLGFIYGGEIIGPGAIIEFKPQKKDVFGIGIGTLIACTYGAVRVRHYSKIDKSSVFIGVGYGGLHITERGIFQKYLNWIILNIGYRFISKSNANLSISIGGTYLINKLDFYPYEFIPILGLELTQK